MQAAIAGDHVKEILLVMSPDPNGTISEQEFIAFVRAEFSKLDRNRSGQVNAKELAASKPQVVPSSQFRK